jgi:hypothetical protein
MRVRGRFVTVLVLVVVAVAGWYSVRTWHHRADERNLRAATAAAHRLHGPGDAVPSAECHGDGLVACWTTPMTTVQAAHALASSMRSLGARPTTKCEQVRVGTPSSVATFDECSVIARYGSRALAVFVNPYWQHGQVGGRIDGSLVSVSAA